MVCFVVDEQGKGGLNQTTFTPFGGGQRLCPGYIITRLEVSIFLHHFVTSFRCLITVLRTSFFYLSLSLVTLLTSSAYACFSYSWVAEDDIIVSFPTVKMKNRLPIIVSPIADPFRD